MGAEVGKGPNRILEKTWNAESAITKNRFVINGTLTGDVKPAGAAATDIIGVAREQAATDEAVSITHEGSELVEAGAAIAEGALVKSDAVGKAVAITPLAAGATYVGAAGRTLGVAAADGDLVVVELTPGNLVIET